MSFNWLLLIMIFLMKNIQTFLDLSRDGVTPLNDGYQCLTLNSGSFVFLG